MTDKTLPSSFRDPSGSVFTTEGVVRRRVNLCYRDDYDHLMRSGLYDKLVSSGLLIPHDETAFPGDGHTHYKVITPEKIPFISYPYEWCFSQLKRSALLVLEIAREAFKFGMCLKDASAYNIQFRGKDPVLIDTLSFQRYRPNRPWVAYRQFCEHFVGPLALMAYRDVRLLGILRDNIDGIPLDLTSSLLPIRSKLFDMGTLMHIHLHAATMTKCERGGTRACCGAGGFGESSFLGLIDSLESTIGRIKYRNRRSAWSGYYSEKCGYLPEALSDKKGRVAAYLEKAAPESVWDLGANTGYFSRIAAGKGISTVSFDADPLCVEESYRLSLAGGESNVLPLVMDLSNPSPAIGWESRERMSLIERGPADLAMALALVHHLAISNNLPFGRIAEFMGRICCRLIIEYIPKDDPMVAGLLSSREDIFDNYSRQAFEREFAGTFDILSSDGIKGSGRTLYLMKRK